MVSGDSRSTLKINEWRRLCLKYGCRLGRMIMTDLYSTPVVLQLQFIHRLATVSVLVESTNWTSHTSLLQSVPRRPAETPGNTRVHSNQYQFLHGTHACSTLVRHFPATSHVHWVGPGGCVGLSLKTCRLELPQQLTAAHSTRPCQQLVT